MEFPRSCVIYLRTTRNTPDVEEVELLFPDGPGVCISGADGETGALYEGFYFLKKICCCCFRFM